MIGAKLEPLVVEYMRGVEGSHDVLGDAFLERGLEPLPPEPTAGERLEAVFRRLARADQLRVASASVRRLVPEAGDGPTRAQVADALDAFDAGGATEDARNGLFRAWQLADEGVGKRIVWAAWMLLRKLPQTSLRIARAVRTEELDVQIAEVAAALAR